MQDKSVRENVSFDSCGLECRGWLYLPDGTGADGKLPAIVMAHGFSAVKEQGLAEFAQAFAAAGFATLVFDYRCFGASDGEPRCQLFPLEMVEDYRNAISWLAEHPAVDGGRIGIWGTSFSGGLVAYTGAIDKRAKAIVAQVPSIIGPDTRRAMNPEKWEQVGDFLLQERIAKYRSGEINYLKVVAPGDEPCVLPGKENYDAYMALQATAPNWRNEITIESLEKIRVFDPAAPIRQIAPRALLIIAAQDDNLIPLEALRQACDRAGEPKKFVEYPIRHFDIYAEPWRSKAVNAAIDWYNRYLC
ncbi:MAG TPA: alpha/beta hydrolase [Gammaproteobacteria bacterium]|nr:alpha/beta hydrolase [Gammaproteobacteria bacterium]